MLARFSALILLLSLSSFAHAADYTEPAMEAKVPRAEAPDLGDGSEYLYQTSAKRVDLTPHVGFNWTGTTYSANNLKRLEATFPLGAAVEYGINQMFTIGLDLNYALTGRTYTCDTKPCPENTHGTGLTDPTLRFKGRNDIGYGTIRYGADLALSVEKAKISSSGNTNSASGGTTLAPWVGYEHQLGPGFIGGKIQYDLYKGDRKIQNDTVSGDTTVDPGAATPGGDSKFSSGQNLALTVFYEAKIKKFTLGAAVNLMYHQETRSSFNGNASVGLRDQASATGLKLYAPIQLTERIALLPAITLEGVRFSNSNVIDKSFTFAAGCGGRFTF